jgi:hypothetical protein
LSGRNLECRSTAFIGSEQREFYVTPTDVFLWLTGEREDENDACEPDGRIARTETYRSFLYRLPVDGDPPAIVGVRGQPINQLSMAAIGDRFYALTQWRTAGCEASDEALTFTALPMNLFRGRLREAPETVYSPLPHVDVGEIENRFTDTHLVYGGRASWGSYPPDQPVEAPASLVVVPVEAPSQVQLLQVPHAILRAERIGNDIVVTGYRDQQGLQVSMVDLGLRPHIASTVQLVDRYESENRSHAFNSAVDADGGLLGLPTVPKQGDSGRFWWRSGASDISYLSVDGAGQLAPIGELLRGEEQAGDSTADEGVEGYECDVSCVDCTAIRGRSSPAAASSR